MRIALTGIVCLLSTTACTTMGEEALAPVDLAIRNVTVVDPASGKVDAARDVLIDEGRIVAVVPAGRDRRVAEETIEGSGGYLIPGLMDMHAHVGIRPVHESTLKLMVANGVTGLRDMSSDCVEPGGIAMCIDELREADRRIATGEVVGPRIVEFASAKVDSNRAPDASDAAKLYRPTNAEQARETAAGLAARGAQIVKIGDRFAPEPFRELVKASLEQGMRVGGHVPPEFSVADVAAMGMTTIEHARDLPVDCSDYGATYRAAYLDLFEGRTQSQPDRALTPGKARDGFNETLCEKQIAALKEHDTWYVPTHLTREMDYRAGDPAYRDDPRLAYIPAMQQRQWNRDLDRNAQASPELVGDLRDFFQLGLRTTGMAHRAGVRIMAGTDANDTMIFPGFSLHDELGNLVAAGLTPMEALQAATSVPADYLSRADMGTIAPGAMADLVLLSADPTADIANTRQIRTVVLAGRVYDRTSLDALLQEVKTWVEKANAR